MKQKMLSLAAVAALGFGYAAPADAQGRGGPPTLTPSKLRAVPAETTAAKAKDPNWKAPRTRVGAPRPLRRLDERRHARHSDHPSGQPGRPRVADAGRVRAAGRRRRSLRDRAVNQETVLRNEFGVRTFGYTSFVVDPPDGQMPALTPAGIARRNASFGVGTFAGGPFNTYEDFSLYDRCITRGVGGIFPVLYGNGIRIMQTPNEVIISYEMVHDTRVIPLDGRPHVGAGDQAVHGRRARPLGRRHARRRDDELHGPRRFQRPQQRQAEADRALHAHRSRR